VVASQKSINWDTFVDVVAASAPEGVDGSRDGLDIHAHEARDEPRL